MGHPPPKKNELLKPFIPGRPLEDFDFGSGRDVLSSMLVLSDDFDRRNIREGGRQVGVGQRPLHRV